MLLVFCSMKNGWTAIMPMEERGKSLLHNPYLNLFVLQALLKMVGSYSTVALSPSRRDALTESPLRIVLFALRKMCDHTLCRNFLRSSELLPVIVHLRQSPDPTISEYASAIASRACQAWGFMFCAQGTASRIYSPSVVVGVVMLSVYGLTDQARYQVVHKPFANLVRQVISLIHCPEQWQIPIAQVHHDGDQVRLLLQVLHRKLLLSFFFWRKEAAAVTAWLPLPSSLALAKATWLDHAEVALLIMWGDEERSRTQKPITKTYVPTVLADWRMLNRNEFHISNRTPIYIKEY